MDFLLLFMLFLSVSLFLKSFHLLSIFISLEMMVMLFIYFSFFSEGSYQFLNFLFFISVSSCESVLGLIIFVYFNRFFSKDYLLSLSVLKF